MYNFFFPADRPPKKHNPICGGDENQKPTNTGVFSRSVSWTMIRRRSSGSKNGINNSTRIQRRRARRPIQVRSCVVAAAAWEYPFWALFFSCLRCSFCLWSFCFAFVFAYVVEFFLFSVLFMSLGEGKTEPVPFRCCCRCVFRCPFCIVCFPVKYLYVDYNTITTSAAVLKVC